MNVAGPATRRQVFNEINITPLTDIFLVLLIIMMVVAPMMQSFRGDIRPPELASGTPVDQGRLTVEVNREGEYFFDGQPISGDALLSTLKEKLSGTDIPEEERTLVVRADGDTRSKAVITLFGIARDAGFYKLTLAGQNKRERSAPVDAKNERTDGDLGRNLGEEDR